MVLIAGFGRPVARSLTEAVRSLWAIGNALGATPPRGRLMKEIWLGTNFALSIVRVGGFAMVDSDHHIVWPFPRHEF